MNKKLWRIEKEIKSLVLRITLVSKQIEMRDKWTLGSHTIRVLSVSRFFSVKRRWWVFTITNIFEGCLWIQCESIQSPCSASLDFIERYHNRVFAYYLMKKFTTEYCATWKILQKYCITIWKKNTTDLHIGISLLYLNSALSQLDLLPRYPKGNVEKKLLEIGCHFPEAKG